MRQLNEFRYVRRSDLWSGRCAICTGGDQAVRLVKGRRPDLPKGIVGDSAAAYIADYDRYISPEELPSRTAEDLTASALDHLAFGATRSRGVTLVRATAGARRSTV